MNDDSTRWSFELFSKFAGVYSLHLKLDGVDIKDSPFDIVVEPEATISADKSVFVVDPSSQPIIAGESLIVSVQARD